MQDITFPSLPPVSDKNVLIVPAPAWKALVSYINTQTKYINQLEKRIETLTSTSAEHTQNIQLLAKALEGVYTNEA